MFRCFAHDGKDITGADLLSEIERVTPQAKINEAELNLMRQEAQGKLSMATDEGLVTEVTEELRSIAI